MSSENSTLIKKENKRDDILRVDWTATTTLTVIVKWSLIYYWNKMKDMKCKYKYVNMWIQNVNKIYIKSKQVFNQFQS